MSSVPDTPVPSVAGHAASRTTSTTLSEMTDDRFDTLPIAPPLRQAMTDVFKYITMTRVQKNSIPVALTGSDMLVKARTGTGKTLAFLLPTLHTIAQNGTERGTQLLVISPTRELAQQIADEARMLLTFMGDATLQVVVGGTNVRADVAKVQKHGPPTVLVATPGRLLDHLRNRNSGFSSAIQSLGALILDEADRLLDMGFAPDLKRIFQELPPVDRRQTLLFSATMPSDVQQMANMAMRPDYKVVDCVGEEKNTHEHVTQSVLVTPMEAQIAALGAVLQQCMTVQDYKVIVFFTTARQTQFCSELFGAMGQPVLEIHSRKSQGHRNRVSDQFRSGKSLIMFTSDVTARGLDYPDVTTVVQVGLPADKAQYIHRIGRTARAGKGGSGMLLLADFEAAPFLQAVSDLPLQQVESLPEHLTSAVRNSVPAALTKLPYGTKAGAYQAWLGFYNSNLKRLRWSKEHVVIMANRWALEVAGMSEPPALLPTTAGKMHLRHVPGLRVEGSNGVPKSENGVGRGGARRGRGRTGAGNRGRGGSGGRGRL